MILPLRLVGGFETFFDSDPKLVNEINFPVVLICVVCLFVAYYKTKTKKYNFSDDEINIDSEGKLRFQSYDVLMQPKNECKNSSFTTKGIN